eukprot:gene4730-5178_t
MCRRFKLLYNIESATIEEIMNYLARRLRLYIILCMVSIILIIVAASHHVVSGWNIASVVLYLINVAALYHLGHTSGTPEPSQTYSVSFSSFFLACFDLAELIYYLYVGELYYLYLLLSIGLQLSTVYLIHKLREKIRSGASSSNNNRDDMGEKLASAPAPPVYATDVRVVPPLRPRQDV